MKTQITLSVILGAVVILAAALCSSAYKVEEVYLACVGGAIRPVLMNGHMPEVRTDTGTDFMCAE